MLYPADSMMTILPSSSDGSATQKFFNLPDYVAAPVQQGDVVGTVELRLAGESIGTVDLIAGQTIERSSVLYTLAQFQNFLGSTYLRVVLLLSVCALGIYGLWAVQDALRNRYTRPRRTKKRGRR
jgi:D-alanyl-D-alanine carboxypeptidase (penicillin-binding protein 5/6)